MAIETPKKAGDAQPHLQAMYEAFNLIVSQLPEATFMNCHPIFDKHTNAYEALFNFLVSLKGQVRPELLGLAVICREAAEWELHKVIQSTYANSQWPDDVDPAQEIALVAKCVLMEMIDDMDGIVTRAIKA